MTSDGEFDPKFIKSQKFSRNPIETLQRHLQMYAWLMTLDEITKFENAIVELSKI